MMTELSGIKLVPTDGTDPLDVPGGKTVIGRGSFMQVTDKRVSRNHATLEIDSQGRLVIVPIHTNPCFFKAHGVGPQSILSKDQPKVLEHGDVVALLPDKLSYRILYNNHKDSDEDVEDKEETEPETEVKESKKVAEPKERKSAAKENKKLKADKADSASAVETGDSKSTEMSMPLGKRRLLPDWMVGAAKRVGVGQKTANKTPAAQPAKKASPVKSPPKTKVANRAAARKPRKAISDDDEFVEDDDDYEEEVVVKKSPKKPAGRSQRASKRARGSDDDEHGGPKRRPRAASLKKPKYTDDDFVISDEDFDIRDLSSGDDTQGRRKNEDSDFILEEDDSGSDWESSKKTAKGRKGKPTPTPSKGRGRRSSSRNVGRSKRGRHVDDDESDEDEEDYVPRVSKRRAAVAAVSRMKESSDYEDDSADELPARKPARTPSKPPPSSEHTRTRGRPRKARVADDEDNVSDKDVSEKEMNSDDGEPAAKKSKTGGGKQPCKFGRECYRKNPKHFEEFSHPSKTKPASDEEEEEEEVNNKKAAGAGRGRQKRVAALKQKEKFAAMRKQENGDSEEDFNEDLDSAGDDGAHDSDFEMESDDSPKKAKGKRATRV